MNSKNKKSLLNKSEVSSNVGVVATKNKFENIRELTHLSVF